MKYRTRKCLLNITSAIIVTLTMLMSFLLLISFAHNVLYIKTYVRGFSMQPTLNMNVDNANIDGDTVYINRVRDIEFNDLVVAHVSWWSKGDIVKRLVGLPGDKIEIRNLGAEYGLYINEDLLYTKEINDTTQTHFEAYTKFINNHSSYGIDFTNNIGQTELGNKCIKLNDGEYFLIGDNWGESTDCLTNGPIVKENIIGRIELVIPYGTQFTLPIILEFMFKHLF